jgi:uncharacterized protein YecE (DUF72 family)
MTGLEYAISPLHDSDKDPTEEDKKAHWHVIVSKQSGSTTENVIKGITDSVNAPKAIALQSVKGYYRYLTHKDNPDKYQYNESEIQTINGFNILNYSEMSRHELDIVIMRIQDIIQENGWFEYCDLLDNLKEWGMIAEWSVARSQTVLFNSYMRSRRHKDNERFVKTKFGTVEVDPSTGEVVTGEISENIKGDLVIDFKEVGDTDAE